jgi:hypothetical protein
VVSLASGRKAMSFRPFETADTVPVQRLIHRMARAGGHASTQLSVSLPSRSFYVNRGYEPSSLAPPSTTASRASRASSARRRRGNPSWTRRGCPQDR